jgi:hypothetical protein
MVGHVSALEPSDSFVGNLGEPRSIDTCSVRNGACSSATPEEGRRLIRAFLGVKNAALRAAIIDLVTKASISTRDAAD